MHLRSPHRSEAGFTLIELLVVILIVGILAAIAIPAFLNQRKSADDASAKSSVNEVVKLMQACRQEKSSYTACDEQSEVEGASNVNWGLGEGQAGAYSTYSGPKSFGAYGISKSGRIFGVLNTNGAISRVCVNSSLQPINEGSCKNGSW